MWSTRKGKVLISLLSLADGTPKEDSPSWVAEKNDNHREETKDKAASDAGKWREGIWNNMVFAFGMD